MNIKPLLASVGILISASVSSYAQSLAEFGSSASNLFTIDSDATLGLTLNQTSSGITVTGSDVTGNTFAGTWANSWTLSSTDGLAINITGASPASGGFTVTFYSSDLQSTMDFGGNFADPVSNNNYPLVGSLSFTQIGGMGFITGAPLPGNVINWSVNTVVPEPSTYALLVLGGLALFFVARRRKLKA
jgi:hypothetical protein